MEQSCEIDNFDGPSIGIGQDTVYLDSSTRSFGICCRVQGPPGYRVTWLRNGTRVSSQQGYEFGEGYLKFSGSLTNGCAKYTCQVEFTAQNIRSNESTEICVGGMWPIFITEFIELLWCFRYYTSNCCKHHWRHDSLGKHTCNLPM